VVYGCHKYFGKWGGDGDTAVILWVACVTFTFVQRYYFGCTPRGWWWLGDGAGVEECCEA
jgi:hypothetical protein